MQRSVCRRRATSGGILAVLTCALIVLSTVPAAAGTGPGGRDRNRRIALGDVTVAAGEEVDGPLIGVDGDTRIDGRVDGSAVVIRGDLTLRDGGFVDGDVVVLRGDARIAGTVDGDVVVLGGRARVAATAVVRGDVKSTDEPSVAGGARVTGDVDDIDIAGILAAIGFGLLLFWWLAVTVSTAILGAVLLALLPRAFESAAAVGRDPKRWWVALLAGLGLIIGLPIIAIAAISSIVGLPLGLGLLAALGLVHAVGYVFGAYFLGRVILRPPKNRFGAFFLGWGILRLAGIVPLFGALVWIAAAIYGIGMVAVAAVRAGQSPRSLEPTAPPPTTPPPTAPAAPEVVP